MPSQDGDNIQEDSKGGFDYEKFIWELDGQFGNIASTAQKIPNVPETIQNDCDSTERQNPYKGVGKRKPF